MEELQIINQNGSLKTYKVSKETTVKELISKLNLDGKINIILLNNKKANMDDIIKDEDEITILPKIAGG